MPYTNTDPKYLKEAVRDIAQICGLSTDQVAEVIVKVSLRGGSIEEMKKLLIAEGTKVVYKMAICKYRKNLEKGKTRACINPYCGPAECSYIRKEEMCPFFQKKK